MLHNVLVSLALLIAALMVTFVAGMWEPDTDEARNWFQKRAAVALLWVGFEFLAAILGWLRIDI